MLEKLKLFKIALKHSPPLDIIGVTSTKPLELDLLIKRTLLYMSHDFLQITLPVVVVIRRNQQKNIFLMPLSYTLRRNIEKIVNYFLTIMSKLDEAFFVGSRFLVPMR